MSSTHPHSLLFPYMLYFLLRPVSLWCFQSCMLLEYGHIFTPDDWACYEQWRRNMKMWKAVSIKLEANKHVTIRYVLYLILQLLYEANQALDLIGS